MGGAQAALARRTVRPIDERRQCFRAGGRRAQLLIAGLLLAVVLGTIAAPTPPSVGARFATTALVHPGAASSTPSAVTNFSSSISRLVELVALAGGGILALVWARVGFGWFSNDISKKVQAKDRARDALIGTLVFTAAITGLVWGLAQWVLTGA